MRNFLLTLSILSVSLFFVGCSECDSYLQRPLEESYFRLVDDLGNDLWFGPSNPFEADSAEVFVINQGQRIPLSTRVQDNPNGVRYVAFTLPPTAGNQQAETIIHLGPSDSVNFFYVTVTDQENCEEFEEVSFILQGDQLICNRCGIPEIDGGSGLYIPITY